MARKTYIIANWKMHCDPAEATLLCRRLIQEIPKSPANVEVVVCPPVLDLTTVRAELRDNKHIKVGAQNAYPMDEGAYTGETSVTMLKGLIKYLIVGHSERRHIFHERDGLIAQKVGAAMRHQITPILCVGETKHDRDNGHAKQVVADQLEANLTLLTEEELHDVVLAYEPVWAIGTGENCNPRDVDEMYTFIRSWFSTKHSSTIAKAVPILYGGSVKGTNANMYLKSPDCNGLLVGGASLNYKDFAAIINAAN